MTAVSHSYRVQVYVAGDDNTVDFNLALDDIAGPPVVTGLITHPTAGQTEMRPFTVLAVDNDGTLTAALTEQSGGFGRWQALGRRVDVQFSQDGGAFTTYGSGRISRLDEADGPGRYRIEISDESWLARKAKIFSVADTTQLWPAGITAPWRGFERAEVASSFGPILPHPTNTDAFRIAIRHKGRGRIVSESLRQWLDERIVEEPVSLSSATASSDNFPGLKLSYAGVPYPIISFSATPEGAVFSALDALLADGDLDEFVWLAVWVASATAPPAAPQDAYLFIDDIIPPSSDLPLHVGVADPSHPWGTTNGWIHPATLTRKIWDQIGVRYDNTSLAALEADGTLPQLAPRISEQVDDAEQWLEDNVWGPCMLIALRGPNGVRKLIDMRLPQDLDPDTLPVLDATNTRANTWRLLGSEAINSILWSYLHHFELPAERNARARGDPPPESTSDIELDGLVVQEREIDSIDGDTIDEIGRRSLELKLLGSLEPNSNPTRSVYLPGIPGSNFIEVTKTISRELLDVFQDGAYKLTGEVGRSIAETLTEGDLVIIDLGLIGLPNPASGARSDLRLVRVMSITRHPAHAEIEFLDLGPKAQPLAAPTLDVQFFTGPRRVEVTISNIPAGATANLEFAYTDSSSEPSVWPIRRTNLSAGTITFSNPPGDGFAHARVRSVAPHRIRSVWVTDFVALNTVAKIIDAVLSIDGGGVPTLALVVSSATMGIRLRFDIRRPGEDPVYGPASDHAIGEFPLVLAGIVVPGSQALSVQIEPWTGFSGGTVTGTAGDIVEVHTDRSAVDLTLAMRATVLDLVPGVSATIRVAVADPLPASDITLAYEQSGTGNITPSSPQTILADDVTSELTTTGFVTFEVDLANTPGQVTFTATSAGRNPASQTVGFAAPGQDGQDGDDASQGPRVAWIRNFGGTVSTDVQMLLQHSDDDGGLLEVWVNPSGTSSPNPNNAADGSVAFAGTPFTAGPATVFGGAGQLLNDVPVSALEDKTVFARFTDSQGRIAEGQHTLKGIIQVIDPFGILTSNDPEGLVGDLALKLVTNPNIADRAVAFRNLVIGSYDNLIADPNFEAAGSFGGADGGLGEAGWSFNVGAGGTWSTTTTNPFAGTYAANYSRAGQTGDATLGTGILGANVITASEGNEHYFQARARNSGSGSGGQARVQIRYLDAAGSAITGGTHESDIANLTFSYQLITVESLPAPAGTVGVQFRLRVLNSGTIDNILWDDCFARLKVDGTLVVDGSILTKHISAGSITTPLLAAKAATIEKLSIGSLGNMIPDPIFSSGDISASDWTVHQSGGGTWDIFGLASKIGDFSARYVRAGQSSEARLRHAPEGMEATGDATDESDQFFFRAYARPFGGDATAGIGIVFRDGVDAIIGVFTDSGVVSPGSWTLFSRSATAPDGTARVDFELLVDNSGTATSVRFDDCYAQKKVDGNLYVDGSITAKAIDVLDIEVGQHIQSIDYVAGSTGWFIGFDGVDDGFAEFSNVIVRGEIAAGSVISTGNLDIDRVEFDGGRMVISTETTGVALLGTVDDELRILTDNSDVRISAPNGAVTVGGAGSDAVGFYGSNGAAKGSVSGSTAGNVALQNLLSYLVARGLLTDNTT